LYVETYRHYRSISAALRCGSPAIAAAYWCIADLVARRLNWLLEAPQRRNRQPLVRRNTIPLFLYLGALARMVKYR